MLYACMYLHFKFLYVIFSVKLSTGLSLTSLTTLQRLFQMHYLIHRIPFLTQGQTLPADGRHDDLSPLAVFLPREQPFIDPIDISESPRNARRTF